MQYYLSRIFYSKQEYDKSAAHITKALLKDKDFFNYYLLGEIYFKQKKNAEAMKAFKSAQKLDPTHGDVHYYIGAVYHRSGDRALGCEMYQKAKKLGASDMDGVIETECK
tara:strand:- start:2299 stop:2628 length:330 start_codon:yes stop_codon:yes gene_type:complete